MHTHLEKKGSVWKKSFLSPAELFLVLYRTHWKGLNTEPFRYTVPYITIRGSETNPSISRWFSMKPLQIDWTFQTPCTGDGKGSIQNPRR